MRKKFNSFLRLIGAFYVSFWFTACVTGGDFVKVSTVSEEKLKGLGKEEIERLKSIEMVKMEESKNRQLQSFIQTTQNYTVTEYLTLNPEADDPAVKEYRLGGYDVIDIIVYEEPELNLENVTITAKGDISFPFLGRINLGGLTVAEAEKLLSESLTKNQYVLNPHITIMVKQYNSQHFMILGSGTGSGTFQLRAKDRLLDAISRAGGLDFEQGGKQAMILRTVHPETREEKKIAIRIDLNDLLKGGNPADNLLLQDKDIVFIPKPDYYYLIGQVKGGGKVAYQEKQITLVEAIVSAGGFTEIAAPNRTRIIRVEDGIEKIIEVRVKDIMKSGKRAHDVVVYPGDIIVVPESLF